MAEDAADRLRAEVALPDVPMTINTRAEGHFGIVEMDEPKMLHPHGAVERCQHFLKPLRGVHGVAGGEQMRRVQTNAHALLRRHLAAHGRELLKLIAHALASS